MMELLKPASVGFCYGNTSNISVKRFTGVIAQLGERGVCNAEVVGSSPSGSNGF